MLSESDILKSSDHRLWAKEFCEIAVTLHFDPTDSDNREWVASWFANAMMMGYDRGRAAGQQEVLHGMAISEHGRPHA